MGRLDGKVALVTGAAQGIGFGIAQKLAAHGAHLVIIDRQADRIRAAAAQISQAGVEVLSLTADVRSRADVEAAVAEAISKFGRTDILINNAQSAVPGIPVESIDDEMISLTLESGLLGTLYCMQACFPHMKEKGDGVIVNIGSREGIRGGVGFGIYSATKEGIRGLSRTAALEWGRYNIRVNVICPAALTPAATDFFNEHPERMEAYRSQIPLGRFGDPANDIGNAAVWLVGPESAYVTGQTLNVDGGLVMF